MDPGDPALAEEQDVAPATGARSFGGRGDTFLGERYRRLVKRRGKRKALVAVAAPSW